MILRTSRYTITQQSNTDVTVHRDEDGEVWITQDNDKVLLNSDSVGELADVLREV